MRVKRPHNAPTTEPRGKTYCTVNYCTVPDHQEYPL